MSGSISLNIDTNSLVFYVDASNKKSIVNGDTIWKDLTENNFDSTLTSGVTYNTNNNGVLDFDGVSSYCQLPQITTDNTIGNYSFSIWFSPTNTIDASNTNYYMMFEAQNTPIANSPDNYLYFLNSGGFITFSTFTPTDNLLTTTNEWFGGKWYNIICTYDISTSTKSIYVNGFLENSVGGIINSYLNTSTYRGIGAYSTPSRTWFFPGMISNFLIYTKTLSPVEVLQNYNTIKSKFGL